MLGTAVSLYSIIAVTVFNLLTRAKAMKYNRHPKLQQSTEGCDRHLRMVSGAR